MRIFYLECEIKGNESEMAVDLKSKQFDNEEEAKLFEDSLIEHVAGWEPGKMYKLSEDKK